MPEWEDDEEEMIDVYVDSDWAKRADRKSTSGGMVTYGRTAVKHWARTQASRALSVGEAEYYALVTGCAEALGMQSVLMDMGIAVGVRVWTDSSTAKSVAGRRGFGKLRHVELKFLWVREPVKNGRIQVRKILSERKPSDHLTKRHRWNELVEILRLVGCEFVVR